jgi:hypothetical protein
LTLLEEKLHAKEESIQGTQEENPNYVRVRVLIDIVMANKLVN